MSSHQAFAPGTVLQGTYEIVRRIGVGGMGEVYEARHSRLPGRFAVKVLTGRLDGSGTDFLRFRREAEIASSLHHPHIVQIVDFNQMSDGAPYIVMEYLDGVDLCSELARIGRFSLERTSVIVGQIAAAVAAAHGRGIVHRDLKPQNVLITPVRNAGGDFVKVVDFGISKVQTAATLTDDAKLLGTPQYMSPEQARGRAEDVDGRTDQFALAVIAYEMLTGRKPFTGDNVPAVLFALSHDEPPPMTELQGLSASAVEAVLRRAMGKKKGDRFATILEFSDALASAIAGRQPEVAIADDGPVGSPKAGPATIRRTPAAPAFEVSGARPPARRHVVLVAGAVVLSGGALGIGSAIKGRAGESASRTAANAPPSSSPSTAPVLPAAPPASPTVPGDTAATSSAATRDVAATQVPAPPTTRAGGRTHRPVRPVRHATTRTTKKEEDHAAKPAERSGTFIEDL